MPITKVKPLKIKPFSLDTPPTKDLLIAECLRQRSEVVSRMNRAEPSAEAKQMRAEVLALLKSTRGGT